VEAAYEWLYRGVCNGATFFDDVISYFKQHFDVLAPAFLKQRRLELDLTDAKSKMDVVNMHDAGVLEMKNDFSSSLGKDRLYHKPCGFLNDQQIWMLGVNVQYFLHSVLRFDHKDFLKAMKIDVGPLLGDTGLWALRQLGTQAKERKDADLKKKVQIATDLIEKYLDSGFAVLGEEKKYFFINKLGPKKCPEQHILRDSVPHLYSWTHYAPLQWFDHNKKEE